MSFNENDTVRKLTKKCRYSASKQKNAMLKSVTFRPTLYMRTTNSNKRKYVHNASKYMVKKFIHSSKDAKN